MDGEIIVERILEPVNFETRGFPHFILGLMFLNLTLDISDTSNTSRCHM